jgi:isopenicillin N synthase-like dioxygenase
MVTGGNTCLALSPLSTVAGGRLPQVARAAPHEDINLITLLCSATAPGLEILSQAGSGCRFKLMAIS